MERNIKLKRRSQLIVGTIILIALVGVVVINNDHVAAEKTTGWTTTSEVQNPSPKAEERVPTFASTAVPSMFKLASALVLVIVCIYLGVWGLKKTMGKKYSGNRQYNALEVLETTYVAPKKSVSLVRVAGKAVLIGVTESQIAVLTELSREETAEVLATVEKEEAASPNFMSFMNVASQKLKELGLKQTGKTALDT